MDESPDSFASAHHARWHSKSCTADAAAAAVGECGSRGRGPDEGLLCWLSGTRLTPPHHTPSMLFAAPQTLRGLLWAVAAAEAQDSMTEEVKARLAEFALQGVHTCTPRALEVMVWATKRSCLDMQDVYHACLSAVCAPPIPRMSNVCPFAWHKHSLLLGVRACMRAGGGSGGQ